MKNLAFRLIVDRVGVWRRNYQLHFFIKKGATAYFSNCYVFPCSSSALSDQVWSFGAGLSNVLISSEC